MSVITGVTPGIMSYALIAFLLAVTVLAIYTYDISRVRRKARRNSRPGPDYSIVFPPSQRSLLFEVASTASSGNHLSDLSISPKSILKLVSDFRLANESTYIYSGFTVGEINKLGLFPDYAKLSGVPLPTPVPLSFNIDTALPRPYRPFRWRWHQNMCE